MNTFACALLLLAPCTLSAQVTRSVRGDTTVIRTAGNGSLGPRHTPVEERRISGPGPDIEFGEIAATRALPNGGVVVFDMKSPHGTDLYLFDANGKFVRTLGRNGGGPGEYGISRPTDGQLNVFPDGTIVLFDEPNHRIDRWSATGASLPPLNMTTFASTGFETYVPATDGSVFLRIERMIPKSFAQAANLPASSATYGKLRPGGVRLDTLPVPPLWLAEPGPQYFGAQNYWFPSPDGGSISIRTDRIAFLLHSRSGKMLLAEHPAEPVRFVPQERDEWNAIFRWQQTQGYPAVTLPATKAPVTYFTSDAQRQRLWLRLSAPAEKVEPQMRLSPAAPRLTWVDPTVWGAFDLDGTWAGEITFPRGVGRVTFSGNVAWSAGSDANDLPVLIKWRLR